MLLKARAQLALLSLTRIMRRLLLLAAAAVANKHDKKHKHHAVVDYGTDDAAKAGGAWTPRRPTFAPARAGGVGRGALSSLVLSTVCLAEGASR